MYTTECTLCHFILIVTLNMFHCQVQCLRKIIILPFPLPKVFKNCIQSFMFVLFLGVNIRQSRMILESH